MVGEFQILWMILRLSWSMFSVARPSGSMRKQSAFTSSKRVLLMSANTHLPGVWVGLMSANSHLDDWLNGNCGYWMQLAWHFSEWWIHGHVPILFHGLVHISFKTKLSQWSWEDAVMVIAFMGIYILINIYFSKFKMGGKIIAQWVGYIRVNHWYPM